APHHRHVRRRGRQHEAHRAADHPAGRARPRPEPGLERDPRAPRRPDRRGDEAWPQKVATPRSSANARAGGRRRAARRASTCARCSRPPRRAPSWSRTTGPSRACTRPWRASKSTWRRRCRPPPTKRSTTNKSSFKLSISQSLARRTVKSGFFHPAEASGGPAPNLEGDATMRFMIIVKASKDSEAGVMPDEKLLAAMGKFNEELVKAGVMLAGEGLHPSSKGARVKFSGAKRTVIDGPFAEAKELIAGYTIIQVKSREEAREWARRFPNPSIDGKGAEIEVRQFFELEDFAPSEAVERFREMEI